MLNIIIKILSENRLSTMEVLIFGLVASIAMFCFYMAVRDEDK